MDETDLIVDLLGRVQRVVDRMTECLDDFNRSPSYDARSSGGTRSDVADKLLADGTVRPDIVRLELRTLRRLVARMRQGGDPSSVTQLKTIIEKWDMPNVSRRQAETQTADEGEPGCRSCARLDSWEPRIFRQGLCRRCYDQTKRCKAWRSDYTSDMPPTAIVDRSLRGIRVTDRVLSEVLGPAR